MSGGLAFVYDEDGQFASRCNTSMVSLGKVTPSAEQEAGGGDPVTWHQGLTDEALLRKMVEDHHKWTGSLRARHILDHWVESRSKFVKVFPNEYKRALAERAAKAAVPVEGGKAVAAPDKAAAAKASGVQGKPVPAK